MPASSIGLRGAGGTASPSTAGGGPPFPGLSYPEFQEAAAFLAPSQIARLSLPPSLGRFLLLDLRSGLCPIWREGHVWFTRPNGVRLILFVPPAVYTPGVRGSGRQPVHVGRSLSLRGHTRVRGLFRAADALCIALNHQCKHETARHTRGKPSFGSPLNQIEMPLLPLVRAPPLFC